MEEDIRVTHLAGRWQRVLGAMFRRDLGREVLVFIYRRPARRRFHTFCCPPLRILALADDGSLLVDVQPERGHVVSLPETRLVVECAPDLTLQDCDLRMLADFVSFMDWEA